MCCWPERREGTCAFSGAWRYVAEGVTERTTEALFLHLGRLSREGPCLTPSKYLIGPSSHKSISRVSATFA